MACCAGHCAATGFFSSRMAERDLRRYRRRGPDTSTRMFLTELAACGLASATLADASPAYLDAARRNLDSRYGSRPAQFIVGDFAQTGAELPDADIVTLDRVVCCYPDAAALLSTAAARSRLLLALTHPRDRWYMRAGFALMNFFFRLGRSPFRIFVHSPHRMASVLKTANFICAARRESFLWSFRLYRRASV